MANPFLTESHDEIETAIMLENAYVTDIGNAVAYTDGKRLFINTEDNLNRILPAYSLGMLKWLLWHERYHMELRHHNRFFKYLYELSKEETEEKFQVTKEEVNIIMDILVHDSLCRMFPELVETAIENLAQMRNRNSLGYTFTTFTLEEMLDEYRKHKRGEDKEDGDGDGEESDEEGEPSDEETTESGKGKPKDDDKKPKDSGDKKGHEEGGSEKKSEKRKETSEHTPMTDKEPTKDESTADEEAPAPPEHDKTDWSKLKDIDDKEFISEVEGDCYVDKINELKSKKIRLAKITHTLNALATTAKERTYTTPSTIRVGKGVILKGRKPGKTALYLVFDASGSMSSEMDMFKDIISKSVPQAMRCPCEWFSGWEKSDTAGHCRYSKTYHKRTVGDYYKGTFADIMPIHASGGYDDDGDRTIDLCYLAEQKGYSPIGVTDGGGGISHESTIEQIKALKRTVIVSQEMSWIEKIKSINPSIQTIYVG